MVRLSNIKREHNILSANYEPEASGEFGFIAVNVRTGDIVEEKHTALEVDPIYFAHAKWALLGDDLKYREHPPETYLVMWY